MALECWEHSVDQLASEMDAQAVALALKNGRNLIVEAVSKSSSVLQCFVGVELATSLMQHIECLDHVGFLVPTLKQSEIERLLMEAGSTECRSFPSVLVAKECAQVCGRERLSVTVLKGRISLAQSAGALEVFLPEATEDIGLLLRRRVGSHVAFRTSRPDLNVLSSKMSAAGYCAPTFVSTQPLENPSEGSHVLYFETPTGRVEFISYDTATL